MQTPNKLLLSLFFLLVGTLLYGQKTFNNPIITGMNPDPSICRVGDDFYLVTSSFEYYPGLPIYKSKDLVNWKMIGYALSRPSNCPLGGAYSSGGNFAPAIRYHNGTFYISCTNYGGAGSQGAFYVTAKNPEGPWSEPYWVGNWNVDPSMMFANDSMYWVSPDNKGSFMVGTMNPETGQFITPLKHITSGLGGSAPEGPHMYKIGNYYYFMSAEGGTGYEHREVMQRSKSPYGPFEASPVNPVVSNMHEPESPFQAIGHADLVQLQDSSWWLVTLGFRPKGGKFHHLGRETFLAPVVWDENGWPKGGDNGVIREEFPFPNLPEHKWKKETARDDFGDSTLGLKWNFIRNPYDDNWSLTARPGFLRLNGSKVSLRDIDSPAFIGQRQTAFDMVASTKIGFKPAKNNEEAGLVVRGDDLNHFELLVTLRAGKRVALFRKYLQGKTDEERFVEIPDGDVVLRISATDIQYQFWVQQEGKRAVLLGKADARDISTEQIGGFIGAFIGMYASGNGQANTSPADFDWFDFEEDPNMPYSWAEGVGMQSNKVEIPAIEFLSATSNDEVKLSWSKVKNAKHYWVEKYVDDAFVVVGKVKSGRTSFTDNDLEGKSMYIYRVKAVNGKQSSFPSLAVSVETLPTPGPFLGHPFQVPGKIEAEKFDYGDEGGTYHKRIKSNKDKKFRPEGVDIEKCWDAGGGHCIGGIGEGDWVVYSVDFMEDISEIQLRLSAWKEGGRVRLELDGQEIAMVEVPPGHDYSTVTINNLNLEKGMNRKLKIVFLDSGFNFNWMNFLNTSNI